MQQPKYTALQVDGYLWIGEFRSRNKWYTNSRSTFGHELEYLKGDVWLADPADPENIKEMVLEAWNAGKYNERAKRLKQRILAEYNWEVAVDNTEKIYKRIIETLNSI